MLLNNESYGLCAIISVTLPLNGSCSNSCQTNNWLIPARIFVSCVLTTKISRDVSILYVQQYIHALTKEYLLLHKPDYNVFQTYMARSTTNGVRPNVDYGKIKLIRINRTDSTQTHNIYHDELNWLLMMNWLLMKSFGVADDVQQVPESMLVQVLCADVGRVDVGRDVVDGHPLSFPPTRALG